MQNSGDQILDSDPAMLYRMLDNPFIYRATQLILSPGGEAAINRVISETTTLLPRASTILDIGCGPRSIIGAQFGLDSTASYITAFPGYAVVGSSTILPFRDQTFDAVVSFGLLHHLNAMEVTMTLKEMQRVSRSWTLVTDPVLPSLYEHPWAWVIRKLDRGGHVRSEHALCEMLKGWEVRRFRYTSTGLEGLIAYFLKP